MGCAKKAPADAAASPGPTGETASVVDPKETGCRIWMPSKPVASTSEVKVASGGTTVNHRYTSKVGNNSYNLTWCDYSPELVKRLGAERIRLSATTGELHSLKGSLHRSSNVALADGTPGVEVVFAVPPGTVPGGAVAKSRVFVVGNRLYQVITLQASDELNSAEADKVLRSFALEKNAP